MLIESLEGELSPAIGDAVPKNLMWCASRLERRLRHGDWLAIAFEEQELDDLGALLEKRPNDVKESHRDVHQFVLDSSPGRDKEFVRYFQRYAGREEALMQTALGMCEGAELAALR